MKHATLAIGLILIVVGSVLLVLDETTYGLVSSYKYPVDFNISSGTPQVYDNQTYVMIAPPEFINAKFLDKIVITTEPTSNNSGNSLRVFIQSYDVYFVSLNGSLEDPLLVTYNTKEFPTYSAIVGIDTGLSNFNTYVIRFGAISTFTYMGTYSVRISVYSKGANSVFLTFGVLLLSDGVIIPLVAYSGRKRAKGIASMS